MLRTLAAEAARRFGQRVSFAAVRPAARPEPVQVPGPPGQAEAASESPVEAPAGTLVSPAAGWQVSYAELDRLSDEAAAGLAFRGVLPGDVVALALPSTPEFPICYLAAVKIGAIVAGLDPRWPPVVLDRLTDLLRPTVTVAPFGLNVGPGPDGELIRVTPATDSRGALAGLRRAELPPPPLPPDPARPAVIAFNSSSSGTPRGAVFGVRQLDAIRAAEAGERWGSGVGSVLLTAVPFAHYSLMTRLPTFLQSGQTCVLMGSWRAEQVPRLAAAVQANRPANAGSNRPLSIEHKPETTGKSESAGPKDANGFKNYGQCVKEWAHQKGHGYGYGGNNQVSVTTNVGVQLDHSNNNVISVLTNVFVKIFG